MSFLKSILRRRQPDHGGLVISREIGEQVFIGDDITVTVVDWKKGGRIEEIELHIEAPKDVKILRGELDRE